MLLAADFRKQARVSLTGKWPLSVLVCIVATLLGANPSEGFICQSSADGHYQLGPESNPWVDIPLPHYISYILLSLGAFIAIYSLLTFIIGGAIEVGMAGYFTRLGRGQDGQLNHLFSDFSILGKALGARIVTSIFIFLWALLLIIPGIIAAYRYSLVPYLLHDNPELGVMDAIKTSGDLMAGNKWRLFCLDFSFIGWDLLCLCTAGIGFLVLSPYIESSHAQFYLSLLSSPHGSHGQHYQEDGPIDDD